MGSLICIVLYARARGFRAEANGYFLHAVSRIDKVVFADEYVVGGSFKLNGNALAVFSVVAEEAALDDVAVGPAKVALGLSEQQAVSAVVFQRAVDEAIVRVAVANRGTIGAVIAEQAALGQAVGDAPAKENALTVASGLTVAKARSL